MEQRKLDKLCENAKMRLLLNGIKINGHQNDVYSLAAAILRDIGTYSPLKSRQHAIDIIVGYSRQEKKVSFYESREWLSLRYKALKFYGRKCMVCGNTPANGAILHVDHIKPRSLFPVLELVLENLQILCKECNLGKSNRDEKDYRPVTCESISRIE